MRVYSKLQVNTYATQVEPELKPFLLHHTSTKMSPKSIEQLAIDLGRKSSKRQYLMFIGFPVSGILITLGIILLLKALGCILNSDSYRKESFYSDDIEDEYEHRRRNINSSMVSA
jgi:hypothetical protein